MKRIKSEEQMEKARIRSKEFYKNNKEKVLEDFKKHYDENREEYLEKQRKQKQKWREEHREEHRERGRKETVRIRNIFIEMYGGKCVGCGEKNRWFLTLDHVNNDGHEIRNKNSLSEVYNAVKNYQPEKYQVLCYNCNCFKMKETYKTKEYSKNEKVIKQRDYHKKTKLKFFEMYGNKCNCCGEDNKDLLTLDHVKNDGHLYKKQHGERGMKEYREAVKKYNPEVYQVLCFNCNCGKERNKGKCPHEYNFIHID